MCQRTAAFEEDGVGSSPVLPAVVVDCADSRSTPAFIICEPKLQFQAKFRTAREVHAPTVQKASNCSASCPRSIEHI